MRLALIIFILAAVGYVGMAGLEQRYAWEDRV